VKRGAIVVVAARGAYTGKPRPALVVQSDLFNPTHASVTICPITSDCVDAPLFRLTLPPGSNVEVRESGKDLAHMAPLEIHRHLAGAGLIPTRGRVPA
jgi:mRNA interferase MazF